MTIDDPLDALDPFGHDAVLAAAVVTRGVAENAMIAGSTTKLLRFVIDGHDDA